jgi:hypothetical protein
MSQRTPRTPVSLPGPSEPSAREQLILSTALSTPTNLPEPFVAARFFFRFDPGFRSELESARLFWRGSVEPLAIADLSEEQQLDIALRLHTDASLQEVALALGIRWGLDPETVVRAIAYDETPSYPSVVLLVPSTEAETGYRFAELRIYSIHAWQAVLSALGKIEWLKQPRDLALFADAPSIRPTRIRGMDGDVAARTLAIHFLTQEGRGRRPTDGTRKWDGAVRVWRKHAGRLRRAKGLSDERPWRRHRSILLGHIFGRLPSAVQLLMTIQDARGLGDAEWAATLGIDAETWVAMRSERTVTLAGWKSVLRALPEVADDLRSRASPPIARPTRRNRGSV